MANTSGALTGVVAIMITPFTDDDALDLPGLVRVVDFTLALGVHGLAEELYADFAALLEESRSHEDC